MIERTRALTPALLAAMLLLAPTARAQYNQAAGTSAPTETVDVEVKDEKGNITRKRVERAPARDGYGNAAGSGYDLAVDGAFEGQTVAVIQLYVETAFDFSLPKAALKEKGFSVYRWSHRPPSPKELAAALEKSCQLWIISGDQQMLTAEHLKVIKAFFDAGHGVYLWGDNQPYYADANYVAEALFDTKMLGDLPGDHPVMLQEKRGKRGLLPNHLLTTGLEHVYEGITIATIQPNQVLSPLIYGSADNLVAAFYDKNGKRAILDGGFTRLYYKWDTAGTARYVKNAAAWLVNAERFKDKVAGR
jgi:hypothetical protein